MVKIKYPFTTPEIRESELKEWLVQVLYPREFSAGGSIKSGAKKRVTSRIHYARKTGVLERASSATQLCDSCDCRPGPISIAREIPPL